MSDGSQSEPAPPKPVTFLQFRQACSAGFRQLHASKTCLVRIRSGSKRVRPVSGPEAFVTEGDFIYFRAGEILTVENFIGAEGLYFSEGFILEDAVVEDFLAAHPNPPGTSDARAGTMAPGFVEAFDHVVQSLDDPALPDRFLTYRTHELLLWLQRAGVAHHLHSSDSLKSRLRKLFEQDVTRAWRAPEAARELGMSEATLRRTLSKEDSGFSELLKDVRLSFALVLIQTTQMGLAEIAYACGFSSQSRLSEAFKSRFDVPPGKLRASKVELERIA
ncbi:MAG: helix-turn-helix transcriptional regulator [Rhodospirillaceae bacterium]